MAVIKKCDLCNGVVKKKFNEIIMQGEIETWEGRMPPAPEGFKYRENESEKGKSFIKVWDQYGKVVHELRLIKKPEKWKRVRVSYEICSTCLQKFLGILEHLRQHYHLEQKEIEVIERPWKWPQLPFFGMDLDDGEDWKK